MSLRIIKIFYFSGTGNSLWSAKKIAQLINEYDENIVCELYNIGVEEQKETKIIIEAEAVVFVFPSYAYGLPLIVKRFAKKAEFKTLYVASFVTFGTSQGGTLGEMRRILKKKKIDKLYFGLIPAVENYLAMFGPPEAKTLERRVLLQGEATKEAAAVVAEKRENKVNSFRPFSSFVSVLFSLGVKVFYKKYKVSKDCNACGICKKICPVSAIIIKDGNPVFSGKCEHCQACVNICPLRAIQFGRVKFGSAGYKHPQIEIADLAR